MACRARPTQHPEKSSGAGRANPEGKHGLVQAVLLRPTRVLFGGVRFPTPRLQCPPSVLRAATNLRANEHWTTTRRSHPFAPGAQDEARCPGVETSWNAERSSSIHRETIRSQHPRRPLQFAGEPQGLAAASGLDGRPSPAGRVGKATSLHERHRPKLTEYTRLQTVREQRDFEPKLGEHQRRRAAVPPCRRVRL